ncbi:hypothetical protein [Streptomyces sp. NPDC048192]|uniref:hypothetical protein n=1 Tax=Streptomyces sp. NPDC048192 TaxID=3365510 RepID=UPI003711B6B1
MSLVPRKTTRQGAQTEAGGPQAVTAAGSAEAPASSFTSTSGAHVAVRPMPRPAPDASPASAAEDQSAA